MRVTNGMIRNTTLNGLYKNMYALNKTYAQMATGKKIQTVSDDPIIAGRALKLTTTVLETNQYESNAEEAKAWMEVTESSLSNIKSILTNIRTKCLQAADGNLKSEDKASIKTDVEQLWKQIQEEGNQTYNGRYIFSGYKTDQALIENGVVNPNIDSDTQPIEYEIGVNNTIAVNVQGMEDIMQDMADFFEGIISPQASDGTPLDYNTASESEMHRLFNDKVIEIDDIIKQISEKTSDLGSRMSRIDYTTKRLVEQNITYKQLLTSTEDIDIEEVYTNFSIQYSTYQSALQATSKIITNTLADYL